MNEPIYIMSKKLMEQENQSLVFLPSKFQKQTVKFLMLWEQWTENRLFSNRCFFFFGYKIGGIRNEQRTIKKR